MLNNLKSKYEKLEELPSDSLWDKLEEQLNQNQPISNLPSEKKNIFEKKWSRYAAVAILLLTLGNIIWMLSPKEKEQNVIVKEIIKTELITEKPDKTKLNITENNIKNSVAEHTNSKDKAVAPTKELEHIENHNSLSVEPKITTIIDKKEDLLAAQPKIENKEKTKYVSASDLLFGVEIDKSRKEQASPNSKLGLNDLKHHPKDQNNFSPKSLKIFGITVYESDSLTKK